MKKNWPLVLGASLLTGIIGAIALPKKKNTTTPEVYQAYIGSWQFLDAYKKLRTLTITSSLEITVDEKPVKVVLIELTPQRLVLRDEYGYHVIIQKNQDNDVTLYDEADDREYLLKRIAS